MNGSSCLKTEFWSRRTPFYAVPPKASCVRGASVACVTLGRRTSAQASNFVDQGTYPRGLLGHSAALTLRSADVERFHESGEVPHTRLARSSRLVRRGAVLRARSRAATQPIRRR